MKHEAPICWLLKRIRKRIPALFFMISANIASAFMGVLFALGTKNVINSAVSGVRDDFVRSAYIQLLIIVLLILFLALYRYLHSSLIAVMDMDWKSYLGKQILHGDYENLAKYHSGELLNFLNNDVRIINEGLFTAIPSFAAMTAKLISAFVVLLSLEPMFTLLLALLGVAAICVTGLARKYLKSMNKAVSASEGKVSSFFHEIFEKLIVVQAMNVEDETERRGAEVLNNRLALQKKRINVSVIANSGISTMVYISGFATLIWCAFKMATGVMSFGELTAITQLVAQLQYPFANLSGVIPRYIAMIAASERLMELEECFDTEKTGLKEKSTAISDFKTIESHNVSFSYGRDEVLLNCSFTIPSGSFVAVTGPSGIGKSTVLKLMLGIFRPSEGEFVVNTGYESIPLSMETRKLFAYVPQGNLLFSGSLLDNLLLTKPEADKSQIDEALRISCMDEFVSQLPDGLNTVIGENAHGLSEGQAQRLSIARAILSSAPVILLDEATSSLDAKTERKVLENIKNMHGKTCIAVTHRPIASEMADMQLVFEYNDIKTLAKNL